MFKFKPTIANYIEELSRSKKGNRSGVQSGYANNLGNNSNGVWDIFLNKLGLYHSGFLFKHPKSWRKKHASILFP